MVHLFESHVYRKRREKLIQSNLKGIALFPGNNLCGMNYKDNTYPFRQDSTFLYFFGLNIEGLAAIIDFDNNETILFGNEKTIDDIVWMGSQPSLTELASYAAISKVLPFNDIQDFLIRADEQERQLHILPAYRADIEMMLCNLLHLRHDELSTCYSNELIKEVVALREIKNTEEIEEITKAVNISVDMHNNAIKYARAGMKESEIAAIVHQTALAAGGDLSFPIIATINGQTLHNHYHGNTIKEGQLFLLDAGAQTELSYAGDLSTTFPVSKCFSTRQKDIYEIAYKSHMNAVHQLKEGIEFSEIHKTACLTIIDGMKEMGFMKGNREEAYQAGAHALFFPCGTGHMLGLDVHDMESLGEQFVGYDQKIRSKQFGLKSLRLSKSIKQGFVVTVEPGIYFIPELIDLWKSQNLHSDFLNYSEIEDFRFFGGLRLEDNYLITKEGSELLGKQRPRTSVEIELMR